MFMILKRKNIAFFLSILFLGLCFIVYFSAVSHTNKPNLTPTILIDAGHGGRDGGAVGRQTKATESFLNLQYALALKKACEQFGYNVVLTRSDMSGLYSPFATNKKRSEMEKRKQIIEKTKPDVMVSIHMNSTLTSSTRGAQVFYLDGAESGKLLAESVQSSLHQNIEYAKKTSLVGDYFILNCTKNPSILVECGFLSNPEEEVLLQDEKYMNNFCYNILCGILQYFTMQ